MLTDLPQLLADGADSAVKFVFGAIVVIIWIIGIVLAQLKKSADRARWNSPQQPQQDWSHLLRDLTAGQNKPYTPATPAPPQLQAPPPQQPNLNRQRMQQAQNFAQRSQYQPRQPAPRQQIKSFVQQNPRPFVQQYPRPQQPAAPKPIQKRPKQVRRTAPPIPQTSQPPAQISIIPDSPINTAQTAATMSSPTSTARSAGGRVTRGQLRKLILWSEILSPPLAIRE